MSRLGVLRDLISRYISSFLWWIAGEIPFLKTIVRTIPIVNRWFAERIGEDVTVADRSSMDNAEISVKVDTMPTPAEMEFKIPVDNLSADTLEVSGVDLRVGVSKDGDALGKVQWLDDRGVEDPRFIVNPSISGKSETEAFRVRLTPRPYIYRRRDSFSIYVSGTVRFRTSFGSVWIPITQMVRIDDDLIESRFSIAHGDVDGRYPSEFPG
ncbi:hypothetical protein [Halorubrum saccharovorum]|uniref:hypothetical protein n=1 Tax=Halorubrum saccharovorum TaxID=2248 RepID=UPI001269285F|nr:hypothetical protein [Halorubrum saccharovorum]